jgi:hypothetical protein
LQQVLTFALALARPQHDCEGSQQSPSGQQLAAFVSATPAKQHACAGLQQSAFGAQQVSFAPDTPPPRTPKSRTKGASNFKVITDLQ